MAQSFSSSAGDSILNHICIVEGYLSKIFWMGTEDFCIIEGYLSMIFWLGIEDFRVHCFWQTVQYHAIPASVEYLSAMPAYGMHFEAHSCCKL